MEKILKNQVPIKILTINNSNNLDKNSIVLIKANQIDTEKLVGLAERANAKIHALVNYSGASDVLNLLQNLNSQGFVEGSYVFINVEDVGNINEIQSIYSNLRQGGYYVGLVNTAKGFNSLNKDDLKNTSFYKMVDQDGDDSITVGDADGYINGSDVDLTGKLSQQPITRKERNTYTNVDVNTDSKGWVGIGQDTVLGGGKGFGYSTMGNDFNTVISPKGIIFRRPDAERMWALLKPKQQAEVSELLDHTVADEIKNQLPGLEKARQQADSAVKFAESAVAASKANSDAIVAQSQAISEAKAAADSAVAEIQQTKANAASEAAAISELDADKLTFYGNGSKASIGASIAQYDQDKIKSTINLQYQGGIEIHSADQQGSILTMHDNTIRLASKSWGNNPNAYQYSGFYAAPNYSLMNTYHKDGTTSGVAIDNDRIWIYGGSTGRNSGSLQADVNWYSLNGKTGLLTGDQISLKTGNTQATLADNSITINNASDSNSNNYDVGIHIKGWGEMTGWLTCMGLSQTSLLSTKTRIEPLDTKVALDKIASADVRTYQFKSDVAKGKTKRHASVIIDDVHDVAQYYTPDEFISENRQGRDDGDIVGYLMGAVQELNKQIKQLKEKNNG